MNKKGFTLIELLASIAIIGIIVTLALVSYARLFKTEKNKTNDLLISEFKAAAKEYGEDFEEDVIEQQTIIIDKTSLINMGYLSNEFSNNNINGVVRIVKNDNKIKVEYFNEYKSIVVTITNGTVADFNGNYSTSFTKYFIDKNDHVTFKILGDEGFGNPSSSCTFSFTEDNANITNLDENTSCSITYNSGFKLYLKASNGTINKAYIFSTDSNKTVELTPNEGYTYSHSDCTNGVTTSLDNNILSFSNTTKDSTCEINFTKIYKWNRYKAIAKRDIEKHQCINLYRTEEKNVGNKKTPLRVAINSNSRFAYKEYNFNERTGLFTVRDPRKITADNIICPNKGSCDGKTINKYNSNDKNIEELFADPEVLSYFKYDNNNPTLYFIDFDLRIYIPLNIGSYKLSDSTDINYILNNPNFYYEYHIENNFYYHYVDVPEACKNSDSCSSRCLYYTKSGKEKYVICSVSKGKFVSSDYSLDNNYKGIVSSSVYAYLEKPINPNSGDYYLLSNTTGENITYSIQKYDATVWVTDDYSGNVKTNDNYFYCNNGICTENISCPLGADYYYLYGNNYTFNHVISDDNRVVVSSIFSNKYPDKNYYCFKNDDDSVNFNECYFYVKQ